MISKSVPQSPNTLRILHLAFDSSTAGCFLQKCHSYESRFILMTSLKSLSIVLSIGLVQYASAFTLWPLVDPQGLSGVLNISTTCIAAL